MMVILATLDRNIKDKNYKFSITKDRKRKGAGRHLIKHEASERPKKYFRQKIWSPNTIVANKFNLDGTYPILWSLRSPRARQYPTERFLDTAR